MPVIVLPDKVISVLGMHRDTCVACRDLHERIYHYIYLDTDLLPRSLVNHLRGAYAEAGLELEKLKRNINQFDIGCDIAK